MTRRENTPPRIAQWLLARALGNADEAQNIIGDLHEEWRTRHAADPAAADAWFRHEARSIGASWLRLRLVRSRPKIPMHQRSSVGDSLVRDAAYALRSLRKSWRFAAGVVLSLGLAVGLGIPVLGLADHFFLRPPPGVADPDRVVRIVMRGNSRNGPYFTDGLTGLDYRAMTLLSQSMTGVAASMNVSRSLGRGAEARTIAATLASASFFPVLGVRPVVGRTFTDIEDVDGVSEPPCVVTFQFWKSTMNGAVDALGKRLLIGAVTYTVVGVAPEGFNGIGLGAVDVFLPIHVGAPEFQGRDPELWTTDRSAWLRLVARLKPGVSLASATADVERVYRLAGERTRDQTLTGTFLLDPVQPGRSTLGNRPAKTALWLSAGGVLLLVLVTANLVSLFLARTAAQRQQLAIRLALGGAWKHLLRLHLIEATILGVLASVLGVIVAAPAVRVARALILPAVTWARPALDLRVGAAAFVLAAGIGAIVALWSSLQAVRVDPADLLRGGAGHATASRRTHRVRQSLLMVQAAIFAALLCGASAFVLSLRRASAVDFGYDMDRLMAAWIPLPGDTPRERTRAVYQRALERVAILPEVESASLGYMEPWYNNTETDVFVPGTSVKTPLRMMFDLASPGHLRTFGTTMRAGRWIDSTDVAGGAPVLVVNEALAKAYWPNETAIGRCMKIGADTMPCRTIVGVVRDARVGSGSIDGPYEAVYYVPIAQSGAYRQVPHLFFRPRGDASTALAVVRRVLQELEPNLPAVNVHPVKDNVSWLTAQLSVGAAAFTAFGILAAIVATIGLYSVLAFLVVEQRRETALRLALGAMPSELGWSVARRALMIVAGGMAIGFVALVPLRTLLEPLLFHTKLLDGWSLTVVAVIGAATAALGALIPTRAILRTDAAGVLRE